MIDNLNQTVEEQDPSLIYIHVPFQDAGENNKSYCRLRQFADDQMKAGKTCITMDVRHTDRWSETEPVLCRGDMAFHCNDDGISKELKEWAREKDNGNPKCTDDLSDAQFADVLAGLAESHHLDKCVNAAFVGSEEMAAEQDDADVIDGIYGPEDEAATARLPGRKRSKTCWRRYLCQVIQSLNKSARRSGYPCRDELE